LEDVKRAIKGGEKNFAYGSILALKEFIKYLEKGKH